MEFYKRFLVDRWGRRRDDFDWRVYQTTLDLQSIGSVLVLQLNDKLGDALMISLLVDALAKARPDLTIAVGTTPSLVEYWRRNPRVKEVAALSCSRKLGRRMGRRIRDAKRTAEPLRGRFDVVVSFEPYAVVDHFALIKALAAKVNVGFNKHPFRLFTYALEERRHGVAAMPVAERTARVMEVFGQKVDCRSLEFSVPVEPEDEKAAQSVLDRLPGGGPRLLFNVYGHGPEKHLTPDSVVHAVRVLRKVGHEGSIVLSVPAGRDAAYLDALREAHLAAGVTTIPPMADIFKLFALVEKMDVVVSPDTAIGHIAAAFHKPQVAIFAEHGTIPIAWKPYNARCQSVLSTSGKNINDLDWNEFTAAVCEALGDAGETAPFSCKGEGVGIKGA